MDILELQDCQTFQSCGTDGHSPTWQLAHTNSPTMHLPQTATSPHLNFPKLQLPRIWDYTTSFLEQKLHLLFPNIPISSIYDSWNNIPNDKNSFGKGPCEVLL